MAEINLHFPISNSAEEEGFNDAGIETFEGDVGDYIARECGQNTADASANGRAELHFNLQEMPIDSLPCLEKLKNVFIQCKNYWCSDPKAIKFFDNGLTWLDRGKIPVLKISDYGTTGLTGEDLDRTGKWYGLVRSKGACNKGEGAGGSFGLGKYATFAASAFRTVYYYTKTHEGDAFQGISRLVTHCNEEGLQNHAIGFIGEHFIDGNRPKYLSIRNREFIPSLFHRNNNEIGTDIYIPAYRETHWKERLIISVLNNFWPAICLGKIVFRVGDKVIDHTNIDICIEENRTNSDFKAYRYFNAYRNGAKYTKTLPCVGDSELRLIVDAQRESNPIAVTRKNGMIIETWGRFSSKKPISGIYICHDQQGNEILRRLEPPRHDKWDLNRGENGKKILSTIKDWIRLCIDEFLHDDESESFNLDAFSKFIPDHPEEEQGEEEFPEDETIINKDGFESTPSQPQKNITKKPVEPTATLPDKDEEDAATADNDGTEENDGNTGTDTGPSGGGDGHGGGGNGNGPREGSGIGETGQSSPGTASVNVLSLRCIYNEVEGFYNMILRSHKRFEGKIAFGAECDDGTIENLCMTRVLKDSQEIPLLHEGKYFEAEISPGSAVKYQIYFKQNEKMSLRII